MLGNGFGVWCGLVDFGEQELWGLWGLWGLYWLVTLRRILRCCDAISGAPLALSTDLNCPALVVGHFIGCTVYF